MSFDHILSFVFLSIYMMLTSFRTAKHCANACTCSLFSLRAAALYGVVTKLDPFYKQSSVYDAYTPVVMKKISQIAMHTSS